MHFSKIRYLAQEVRVRFAPSPTGALHVGSLRTALFNYLFARHHGGRFIVRIEDTDQQRVVPGCAESFEATLNAFGLHPDESPHRGGPVGPYVQSQRRPIYSNAIEQLVDAGHAYPCFCTPKRLDILRKTAASSGQVPRYDNRCRSLDPAEAKARIRNGEQHVYRFRFDEQMIHFRDIAFGANSQLVNEGDFVVIKSDGYPTYHFANVVDDHAMKVSHVIRGAEWLPSTPKHICLYDAFGWSPPSWLHLPLITRDGRKKLSKRDADAFVQFYTHDKGYLPGALLNFLIRNGSGIRDFESGRIYSLDEMVEAFDEQTVGTRDFMMDNSSLTAYGRLSMRTADRRILTDAIATFLKSSLKNSTDIDENLLQPAYISRVVDFLSTNEENFSCLSELTDGDFRFFFGRPKTPDRLVSKFDVPIIAAALDTIIGAATNSGLTVDIVKAEAKKTGLKSNHMMAIVRCALIDSFRGPPLSELFAFFSSDEILARLSAARSMLDGVERDSGAVKAT